MWCVELNQNCDLLLGEAKVRVKIVSSVAYELLSLLSSLVSSSRGIRLRVSSREKEGWERHLQHSHLRLPNIFNLYCIIQSRLKRHFVVFAFSK